MRQPITPTALQPRPMHIHNACLPHALHLWKHLSRLKATRGKKPKSSSRVNNGKKIAIGGSITEITHAATRYTPNTNAPVSHSGAPSPRIHPSSVGSNPISFSESHAEGTFAPEMVM